MIALFLGLMAWLLPYLVTVQMTRKKEVSLKWKLIIAAIALLMGPMGILAAYAAKRFSMYSGKEFDLKNIEYEISRVEASIKKQENLIHVVKSYTILNAVLPVEKYTRKLEELQEHLSDLNLQKILLKGKETVDKETKQAENKPIEPSEEKQIKNDKTTGHELTAEEKKEKKQKARDVYERLNQSSGQSQSSNYRMRL